MQILLELLSKRLNVNNPSRYYILSFAGIKEDEKLVISGLITEINIEHGCQVIINGIMPTIKYYLRLVTSLEKFMTEYSSFVEKDIEIKKVHKEKFNELIDEIIN